MKAIIISFCLICAISAKPITLDVVLESHEVVKNSTTTFLVSQSSGNDTSEVQSSEESVSKQSSESESSESVESSDNTSEESDSESVESNEQTGLLVETSDDSMGSEENVRKSWVRVFETVLRGTSAEDNTEVTDQPDLSNNRLTEKQPTQASTVKTSKHSIKTKLALVQKATAPGDSSSESSDSTDGKVLTTITADSSQSVSSESNETSEASDSASDSAQSSESQEDSNGSDSAELSPIKDCVNGTQSCESEEYVFQDIGDDAHYSENNFMVPDEDDRELSLRR